MLLRKLDDMAKSVKGPGVRDIIADIRHGEAAPTYVLMGEEAYYIDLIVENLEKYVVNEADRDFNYNVFYGNDADIDYVVATAQQFPVMADRKLVILKEAQSMNQAKTQLERFGSYLARPNQTTVFVIVYKGEPFGASSKLIKGAKEGGAVIFRSDVPRDYELESHVRDYCQSKKMSIEDKAMKLLCEYIGPPLSKLFGELNKLISIKGGKGKITSEDVEKNIGISKDFNNFELINALSTKDYPKAMKIVKYFESNPKSNPTVMTTSVIFNYFANLVIAHYLPDKSDKSLMETFGFKAQIQLRSLKDGLRNYSAMQAVNAIHYLREFDTKSKGIGSYVNEYALLRELIFKLFT